MTTTNVFPHPVRHPSGALPAPALLGLLTVLCGLAFLLRRRPVYLAIVAALVLSVLAPGCGSTASTTSSGSFMIAVQGTYGTYIQSTTILLDVN